MFTSVCFWLGGDAEIFGILDTGREVDFNTLGYIAGCFVSILGLFLFLRADKPARETNRYNDWRISAWTLVRWITFGSWVLGALHLWFWMQDLTRP